AVQPPGIGTSLHGLICPTLLIRSPEGIFIPEKRVFIPMEPAFFWGFWSVFVAQNGNVDKSVENLMGATGNQSEENVNFTVKLFCTTPKKFSACIFYTLLKEIGRAHV